MNVFRFIVESSKELRHFIAGMFVCTLIIAIDANLRPYIIKLIIDQSSHFDLYKFAQLSSIYILSQIAMIITNSVFDWFGTCYHTSYRARVLHLLVDRLTTYSYRFFQETPAGTITSRINDAFNTAPMIVFTTIRWFIHFILLILIAITMLAQISYLFALATISWIGIFILLTVTFYKKYTPVNSDYATCRPKIYRFLSDYFTNILSVWCFSNRKTEKDKFSAITSEFVEKGTIAGKFLRNFYSLHGIIVAIYMTFILLLLGYLSANSNITPGDFALVFMVNYKITDSLFEISNMSRDFIVNCGIVSNSIKLLDERIEITDKDNALPLKIKAGEIKFDKVAFHYKGVAKLFRQKSVTIHAGQKVGLVGYSGSGKSTFVNLILRLYEVTSGSVLIDNQDVMDVTQDSLRANIAMIPQDPSLFNRSIMENIRYGRLDATDDEVLEASKQAEAHDFISKSPQGYESLVGERGIKLSGGQRQRIAIARAILKTAPILILDEATSQLDSITEGDIQESLWELMQDKTVIIIAHRLSTLLHMNRILVFDQGQIVEDGTHQELLNKAGLYKTLWDAQVCGFLPKKRDKISKYSSSVK